MPERLVRPGVVAARRHLAGDGEPGGQRVRVVRAQRPLPGREHLRNSASAPAWSPRAAICLGDGEPGGQRVRVIRPSVRCRAANTSRNSSSAPVCSPRAAISRATLNRVASVSG